MPLKYSLINENVGLFTAPLYPSSLTIAFIRVVFPDPISPLKINILARGFKDKIVLAVSLISSIE